MEGDLQPCEKPALGHKGEALVLRMFVVTLVCLEL